MAAAAAAGLLIDGADCHRGSHSRCRRVIVPISIVSSTIIAFSHNTEMSLELDCHDLDVRVLLLFCRAFEQ